MIRGEMLAVGVAPKNTHNSTISSFSYVTQAAQRATAPLLAVSGIVSSSCMNMLFGLTEASSSCFAILNRLATSKASGYAVVNLSPHFGEIRIAT